MSDLTTQPTQRVIQVYFNGEAINLQTNASKWSEIVPLIENHENGFSLSGKKAVLGSTKGVLQLPDALIPDGNQVIFLVQDKMKSGAALKAAKPFADMPYVDLRREVKRLGLSEGLGSNPKRETLIDILTKGSGLKEIKGSSKVAKEKKETIIKEVKTNVEKYAPNLEERTLALETMFGTMIEGFGEILDSLRGKSGSKVIMRKQQNEVLGKKEPISTKVKTKAELDAEFNAINFR